MILITWHWQHQKSSVTRRVKLAKRLLQSRSVLTPQVICATLISLRAVGENEAKSICLHICLISAKKAWIFYSPSWHLLILGLAGAAFQSRLPTDKLIALESQCFSDVVANEAATKIYLYIRNRLVRMPFNI